MDQSDARPPKDLPRQAATVILTREREEQGELETLLLCRHRGSGFMASAFVFPGGIEETGDDGDLRVTAARELFEEGGVLLADRTFPSDERAELRKRVLAGAPAAEVLAGAGAKFDAESLSYFAHWLTPSAEKRRYSAKFFIARMPAGQDAAFDDVETVDQVWVTADEALARAGELKLPPPQVRTFIDMREAARSGWSSLSRLSAARAESPAIILPRFAPLESGFALLLPWDPDYQRLGTGDAIAIGDDHPLAVGPSRFVLEDKTWKNVAADSKTAG